MSFQKRSAEIVQSFRGAALFLASAVQERDLRSVLFAGPRGREGTTTALLNVAREHKKAFDLRPLVVEINRQRPALGAMFKLDREKTFEAVAAGQPVNECIQQSRIGLEMIPARRRPDDAAEAIPVDKALTRILAETRGTYDIVLVDAPPVLTHTDTLLAGKVVPNVMLVVRAGKTRYELIERVRHDLAEQNVTIIGAILNRHKRFIPGWVYRMLMR